jgi:undecaprenyl-diphosphatase
MSIGVRRGTGRRPAIPVRALVPLVLAAAVLLVAAVGFGFVTHSVTSDNRIAAGDPRHLSWFTDHKTRAIVDASHLASHVGAVTVLVPLAILAVAVFWRLGIRLAVAVAPLAALVCAGAGTYLLKVAIDRPSPAVGRWAFSTDGSFPSGHAADSAALFVAVAMVTAVAICRRPLTRAAVLAAGFAIPAGIGVSRLVLGTHWPTDVLAGWGLGAAAAIACVLAAMGLRPVAFQPEGTGDGEGEGDGDSQPYTLRELAVRPRERCTV